MSHALSPEVVATAIDAVSSNGRFAYTRNNLLYELAREAGELAELEPELARYEREQAPPPGMISATAAPTRFEIGALPPDVAEYAVPRALVFERMDPLLSFIANGFHRKLEVALLLFPDYPSHMWGFIERQLASGFRTRLFAVHDATPSGYDLAARIQRALPSEAATVIDLGLTLPWAFRLRIPLRRGEPARLGTPALDADRMLLEQGCFVELEALRPREAMQWVYDRIADEAEEVGFG
jgi:hypothetical protein